MVRFSKYEFNNKLLDGVILFRVTPGIIWTKPIYIYIYIFFYFLTLSDQPNMYNSQKKNKILFHFVAVSQQLNRINPKYKPRKKN